MEPVILGNKVLREVIAETNVAEVWPKLETLYMTKYLANKLYLKKKLYTFYMSARRKIFEHIDEFNKIILDIANIEVKFEDEYLALLLLASLSASYEHFADTLLYGREALTLEDVMAALNLKKIKERSKGKGDNAEGLYVRGRTDRIDLHQNYPKNNRKKSTGYVEKYDQPNSSGSIYDDSKNAMGAVYCWVTTWSVRSEVLARVVLSGTRRDNCVYSLDGHAVVGEINASGEEKNSLAQVWHKRLGHISEARLQELGKKSLVDNETGRTVKKLRMDNGLEFCNREFEQLCVKSMIASHLTVFGLPKTFWAEATCTTAYLINMLPLTTTEKKTPIEMWSGHLSDYGMLRIFGYVAYSHVKQGKLESRASVEELQVEVELQSSNNHTLEEDQTDQEDGDDEDARDQETNQTPNLTYYHLVQDREPKTRTKPLRFQDESNMIKEGIEGVQKPSYNSCVYYRSYAPGEYIYLLLYVDDTLIACKSNAEIESTKSFLKRKFDMKELGEAKKILGMEIIRDRSRKILRVSQCEYISKILNKFKIDNGKSVQMPLGGHFKLSLKDFPVRDSDVERMSKVLYANAVGSLMYLMVHEARHGVCANVSVVYETDHGNHVNVTSFVDLDYTKDPDKCRFIIEAEYIALTEAVKEAIWVRRFLKELGMELNIVAVNCVNQGMIYLTQNHIFHERTKHINVSYHFIREVLEAKTVDVLKVGTEHNAADALTKVVHGLKLQHCLELLSVGVG
ncbi:retrovirus-related pol polyprotein from transposon TNT 1-94 [Tanacetum coccineum]